MTPPPAALVGYALQALVAYQARRLATLRPLHRPFALLAGAVAIADPLRWALGLVRHAPRLPVWSWHLDRALEAGWPVGVAACSWAALQDRQTAGAHALGALGLGVALQVAFYPASAAPWVLPVIHGLGLAAGVVAAAGWARRRRWPDETQRLVLLYLAAEAVVWPLVWAGGDARARWPLSTGCYLLATGGAAVMQGVWWRALGREAAPK